jgi:LysR family transcriptional regulator of gallate degradation
MPAKKLIDMPNACGRGDALQINLRHLQAFSAVAATGSVTQAADTLFRVASAVTRAVAELEASLGVSLFERKARGMLMNGYGEAVRARAQRVEQEFAAACQELAAATRGRMRNRSRRAACSPRCSADAGSPCSPASRSCTTCPRWPPPSA